MDLTRWRPEPSFLLPIPAKHFVHAERDICVRSKEQRSCGSRKNREIEGRLDSHRHRQRKCGQKTSAQQCNNGRVRTENQERPKTVSNGITWFVLPREQATRQRPGARRASELGATLLRIASDRIKRNIHVGRRLPESLRL